MGRLIDEDDVYITLTDYYHHRTDIQHAALREAISRVPSAQPDVPDTNVGDTISRQVAIDALSTPHGILYPIRTVEALPSAQPEQHYCRECKWSRCHINVDKNGNTESYWHCLNWDGGTDEEGYCYEWERRTDDEG